jgi:hypothetical protein
MKNLKLTKARISKLQEAAIKVSGFIDTLHLTSDDRTDLYAALLYAHVKNAQHAIGELPGLECVLERFGLMVSKVLPNTKVIIKNSYEKKSAVIWAAALRNGSDDCRLLAHKWRLRASGTGQEKRAPSSQTQRRMSYD